MEVYYTIDLKGEKHKVKVTCECGKCSLLSSKQLEDIRSKMLEFSGKDSPEEIKVICN